MDVGVHHGQFYVSLRRERRGLRLRSLREVERQHVKSLFGKPNAIATLAVGNSNGLARSGQQFFAGREKDVRRFAEDVIGDGIAAFPPFMLAQVSLPVSVLSCAQRWPPCLARWQAQAYRA